MHVAHRQRGLHRRSPFYCHQQQLIKNFAACRRSRVPLKARLLVRAHAQLPLNWCASTRFWFGFVCDTAQLRARQHINDAVPTMLYMYVCMCVCVYSQLQLIINFRLPLFLSPLALMLPALVLRIFPHFSFHVTRILMCSVIVVVVVAACMLEW